MPSIASFRGLRYDPAHVGAIAQVIAPPADAIDPASRHSCMNNTLPMLSGWSSTGRSRETANKTTATPGQPSS